MDFTPLFDQVEFTMRHLVSEQVILPQLVLEMIGPFFG